ncbi:hypothetical protein J7T55_001048 [Diaporthe amygdali]|uniref:uncharacterized protein n=1 Tax=Phomopsis amygdali TaxID=1214568 RepID=UPI0022FDC205|nr:uncharacterized protein J7T55_001048 [Diaporthe amygdali]KAJ0120192.1 hypothetical protein J7T55_001048 [Diaporthe amygdali]
MSGIEVAGIVLGAYPVLLETAKDLREVFKDVKTWWRFEREFENFLSVLETEHIKYSLNLQILLEDLDIPEEDKDTLQVDPTASGWYDVQTQVKLRRRIQDRYYNWFMRQLAAMNRALGDLQDLLPTIHYVNFSSIEREMFRLKTSFTHRKDVLLAEVRDRNNEIFTFLERAAHLSSSRTPPPPRLARKQTTPLLALQSEATALYETFQMHLHWKPEDKPTKLKLIRWPSNTTKKEEAENMGKASPPTVRFADDSPNEPTAEYSIDEGSTVIYDLCRTINPTTQSIDNPENQLPLQGYKIESFEAFVRATPRRDARLKVGRDLILAILSLGTSSWVPASWTAKDLFLIRDPTAPVPRPYFNHTSLRQSLSSNESRSTAKQTRDSLFSLGVLLLELVFRDQLENQHFRAGLMGPNSKPTAVTDLATALLWQQKVEEELGHDLADSIKRCLVCMFEQAATPDLGNSGFVQAVWQQVVRPIESFISAWNRS